MLENELIARGYKEVTDKEVYSDLYHFGEGYIQQPGQLEAGLYQHFNPMIYGHNEFIRINKSGRKVKSKRNQLYRIILDDNLDEILPLFQVKDMAILTACGYYGKNYRKPVIQDEDGNKQPKLDKNGNKIKGKNPQILFGFILDLDNVTDKNLVYLLDEHIIKKDLSPMPNYIACSGGGFHLYYVLDNPIRLDSLSLIEEMNYIKSTLTRKIWTDKTSGDGIQIQAIDQGYRLIGGKTKRETNLDKSIHLYYPDRLIVRAFRTRQERYSLEELKYYTCNEYYSVDANYKELYEFFYHDWLGKKNKGRLTLAEAKEKYPEWYQKRIIEHKKRNHYIVNRAVYDSYLVKCRKYAQFGHRYKTVWALAITALQCGVPYEELKRDALELVPVFTRLRNEKPFFENEAIKAINLGYFNDDNYFVKNERKRKMTLIEVDKCKRREIPKTRKENLELARLSKRQIDKKIRDGNIDLVYGFIDKWIRGDRSIPKRILDRDYPRISDIASFTGLHRNTIRPIYSTWVKDNYKVTITTTRYTPSCEEERIIFDTLDKWYNKDKTLDDRYLNMPILTPSDIHSITSVDIEKCNQYFLKWYEMLSEQINNLETTEKNFSAKVPGGKELFWQALRDKATTGDPHP